MDRTPDSLTDKRRRIALILTRCDSFRRARGIRSDRALAMASGIGADGIRTMRGDDPKYPSGEKLARLAEFMKVDQGLLASPDPATRMPWEPWDQTDSAAPGLSGGPYRLDAAHPGDAAFAEDRATFRAFYAALHRTYIEQKTDPDYAALADMAYADLPAVLAGGPDAADRAAVIADFAAQLARTLAKQRRESLTNREKAG